MKYRVKQLLDDHEIMSCLFFECVPKEKLTEIAERKPRGMEKEVEIELIIDGLSVDPKPFFDLFFEQYDTMIQKEATKIVLAQTSETFSKLRDSLYNYEQITESWAKDINWDTKHLSDQWRSPLQK